MLSSLKREVQIDEVGHEKVPVCQEIRVGFWENVTSKLHFWNYKYSSGKGEGAVLEEECFRQGENIVLKDLKVSKSLVCWRIDRNSVWLDHRARDWGRVG